MNRRKHLIKRISALLMCLCLLLTLTGCSTEGRYQSANKLLAKGEYQKAAEKLEALGSFEDAPLLTMYAKAAAAGEAGLINFVPATDDIHWQSRWRGIMMGASWGLLVMQIAFLVRNILALKDEKRLKKLYVETNDEREIQIWTAARSTAMQLFLMVGVVAAIVAGYFSMTVSITIIVCMFLQSITGFFCMLYYRIKL
jgi:hypothetical protein